MSTASHPPPRFTLRQLEVFVAVVQTGHFGRAADALGLSQPTVSADLRSLERALNAQLLVRKPGGSTPTAVGRAVHVQATELLRDADRLVEAAGSPGSLRLAATPSTVNRLVPELLSRLESDPEAPSVEVLKVGTGGVEELVARGEADAGLGHYLRAVPGARRARLGDDPLYVLTARGALDPERPAALEQLAGRSLLLWPREQNPLYFDAILAVCRERGHDPDLAASASEFSGAHSYRLRTGESFCLVPEDYALEAPASLSGTRLDPPATLPLQILYRAPAAAGAVRVIQEIRALREEKRMPSVPAPSPSAPVSPHGAARRLQGPGGSGSGRR